MRFIKLLLFTLIILFSINYKSKAQEVHTISKDTTLFNYSGKLTYNYYITDNLTCLHGKFSFVAANDDLHIDGEYQNGKRFGQWDTRWRKTENNDSHIIKLKENYDNQIITVNCLEIWLSIYVAVYWAAADTCHGSKYCETSYQLVKNHIEGSFKQKKVLKNNQQTEIVDGEVKNDKFSGKIFLLQGKVADTLHYSESEDYYYGNCYRIIERRNSAKNDVQLFACELDTTSIKQITDQYQKNPSQTDYVVGDTYYSVEKYKTITGFESRLWELPDYMEVEVSIPLIRIAYNFVKTGTYRAAIEKARIDSLRKIEVQRLEKIRQDSIRDALFFQKRVENIAQLGQKIVDNNNSIKSQYEKDKNNRKIYAAYLRVIEQCDVIKNDTSINYLTYLQRYANFQSDISRKLFQHTLTDSVMTGANKIIATAGETFKAIADSYSDVLAHYDLTPDFSDINGYYQFISLFDSVLQVQSQYHCVLKLQKQIVEKGTKIVTDCPASQKDVGKSYTKMQNLALVAPHFNHVEDGELYLQKLQEFIKIQQKFEIIVAKRSEIELNNAEIVSVKNLKGIVKSYQLLLATYPLTPDFVFLHQADTFIISLDDAVRMQKRYKLVLAAPSRTEINEKLKNVEDTEQIKTIIGLQ